jgi:transglutaminase-like putative cysteine protease
VSALRACRTLAWALDALAFGAVALTAEVHPLTWAVAAILLILRCLRLRANRILLTVAYVLLIGAGLALLLTTRTPPVLVAAQLAPLAHALVWCVTEDRRSRGWRLGMGFVQLVLASAITSEFYLPVVIVLFVVLASVALSCEHLNAELSSSGKAVLPASYIRGSIAMSILIFLTSALIFPLLPRMQAPLSGDPSNHARTGYSEEVNLSQWLSFTGEAGGTILRLFPEQDNDLSQEIYLGLLRGRILDRFEHDKWSASPESSRVQAPPQVPVERRQSISVDVIREPLHSPILPVPYGTQAVWLEAADRTSLAPSAAGGQWVDPRSIYSTVHYRLQLDFGEVYAKTGVIHRDDLPLETETSVPTEYRTPALERLAEKIFAGARNDLEKVDRIRNYYIKERYSATLSPNDQLAARKYQRLRPIERFLFVDKTGHCELFSSSAALLLRLSGVPTRLIAGFRLTRGPIGGVLNVRNGDAHAWLEAWTRERGWIPLDLTPRVKAPWHPWEYLRDRYDLLGAYWSRYVVGYGEHSLFEWRNNSLTRWAHETDWDEVSQKLESTVFEHWTMILVAILGGIALLGLAGLVLRIFFPTWFSIRWRVREGPPKLRRERRALERLLKRRARVLTPEASRELEAWHALYLQARFAPHLEGLEPELAGLAERRRAIQKALRAG